MGRRGGGEERGEEVKREGRSGGGEDRPKVEHSVVVAE